MASGQRVSLVLGSGGARGLAHIGIIQWLQAQGYRIESISGCSMGALVGGIYAAGKLDSYRDWVCALRRTDVLRFLDLAFHPAGLIKGDRIMDRLRQMVGEHNIEQLPIAYTAVATDIERQREIWITKGSLFDAIRGSIAVPTLFTPHCYLGLTLVDGGLLNPVPIAPTFRDLTDLTIAVNLNGDPQDDGKAKTPVPTSRMERRENRENSEDREDLRGRILNFLDSIGNNLGSDEEEADELGIFELMSRSFETMQNAIAAMKLAAYAPDVLLEVPRDACEAHEFHRARELIDVGYRIAEREMAGRFPGGAFRAAIE
ncbi:patatin-like phospholipase family protein [Halochromatium salexigens]|uniref:Serine protease n=1 Tax=Halochromatium salexigens TaxID=49447 RepID=A0AAJ0UE70_HALSE|nr:patatin-like phospholipase family protein [Halochromatium salexigens]MBK5929799.1 serine protease [Halochromatium salexigens]